MYDAMSLRVPSPSEERPRIAALPTGERTGLKAARAWVRIPVLSLEAESPRASHRPLRVLDVPKMRFMVPSTAQDYVMTNQQHRKALASRLTVIAQHVAAVLAGWPWLGLPLGPSRQRRLAPALREKCQNRAALWMGS